MVLHIFPDDKFIDYFIVNCNNIDATANQRTQYIVLTDRKVLKYVKHESAKRMNLEELKRFMNTNDLSSASFHFFKSSYFRLISDIPQSAVVSWFIWGSDFYSFSRVDIPLYLEHTANRVEAKPKERTFKKIIYDFFNKVRIEKNFLSRLDHVFSFYPYEYEMLQHRYGKNITAKFHSFSYFSDSDLKADAIGLPPDPAAANRILVGNSADPRNNHVDALFFLDQAKWPGEIICPLSYGGTPEYREHVIATGNKLFGERFKPINNFMTLEEYNRILNSVGYAIFFTLRRQAGGNITFLAANQKFVFLLEDNPFFSFFRRNGVKIFAVKDFQSVLSNPAIHNLKDNAEKIKALRGANRVEQMYEEMLKCTDRAATFQTVTLK